MAQCLQIERRLHCRMGQQDFRLGSKQQCVVEDAPVEWFLAKRSRAISRRRRFAVPQREGKHAVELLDHFVAILFVKMRKHFGVGRAAKRVAALFEIAAQLAIVVDLAVENDGDALVFVEDGCSPVTRSMMARRRMPSATPVVTNRPSESGPRWTMRSHIACSSSRAPSGGGVCESRLAQPVIPHILFS